jgi:hypothetical protein
MSLDPEAVRGINTVIHHAAAVSGCTATASLLQQDHSTCQGQQGTTRQKVACHADGTSSSSISSWLSQTSVYSAVSLAKQTLLWLATPEEAPTNLNAATLDP